MQLNITYSDFEPGLVNMIHVAETQVTYANF